jgi:rhombotail lipoprotein
MTPRTLMLLMTTFVLTGCTVIDQALCGPGCNRQQHDSTSLVEFLYPRGAMPPPSNTIPELHIPLRVGLAFLPSRHGDVVVGLEAARRDALLEQIRARFTARKFVGEIVIIPDYYLQASAGREALSSVQRLYGIDVMALVSYDQVTYTEQNALSFAYLTIVGGYLVKGTHNDIVTLVDLAVIDPATRSLVLRAGGTDSRHRNTTAIDLEREKREAAGAGMAAATEQMIEHFDTALTAFEGSVRDGKANVRVVNRDGGNGRGGGGSMTVVFLLALAALSLTRSGTAAKVADLCVTFLCSRLSPSFSVPRARSTRRHPTSRVRPDRVRRHSIP